MARIEFGPDFLKILTLSASLSYTEKSVTTILPWGSKQTEWRNPHVDDIELFVGTRYPNQTLIEDKWIE